MPHRPRKPKSLPASATFTPEEVAAVISARDQGRAGNPAAVRAALLAQPIRVGHVEVPVLTMGKVLVLEEIGSPLVKPGAAVGDESALAPTNEQILEAIYAVSQPAASALEVWSKGKPAWRAAVFAFADTIPVPLIPQLGAALGRQIALAESTVLGANHDSSASSDEDAGARGEKKTPAAPVISSPRNPTG